MQTPAAAFAGAIYRGNDEHKRLYASAIRHDGCSSIKKNQLTRRTANSRPTAEQTKRKADDSFSQSQHSSIVDAPDPIQTIKLSVHPTALEVSKSTAVGKRLRDR